jgi:hypothetical protein
MLLALALMVAAPLAQPQPSSQPWIEMSGGPMVRHRNGGFESGPLLRLQAALPLGERFAGELWAAGSLQSAPLGRPGDQALVGGGLAARFLLRQFDTEGRFALWAHGGAGYLAAAAGNGLSGPTGFGGAALVFQPLIRRFAIGLEVDAVGARGAFGFAVLPTLRCAL